MSPHRTEAELIRALKAGEPVSRAEILEHRTPEQLERLEHLAAAFAFVLADYVQQLEAKHPRLTHAQVVAVACRRLREGRP